MSIRSFVSASEKLYELGFHEESLCLACIAVDAVASIQYPKEKCGTRYKKFIEDQFRIISETGFSGILCGKILIKVNTTVDNLKPDENGYVCMEQIIYHMLRCGLVHNCEIEKSIVFTDDTLVGDWNEGKFLLPKAIVKGLVAAVKNLI
jgi:hypothetical protein